MDAEIEEFIETNVMYGGVSREQAEEMGRSRRDDPRAPTLPVLRSIRLDETGSVWVEPFFGAGIEVAPFEVFAADGTWLSSVSVPAGLRRGFIPSMAPGLEIGDDYLLGVWTDSQGVEYVPPLLPGKIMTIGVPRVRAGACLPLLAIAAACVACGPGEAADEAVFTPELIGTAAVPLSESEEVALLADERTACVIDSYEGQVRCVDGEGSVVGVFGREGEGPGEFGDPTYLARGEAGTVGVVDSDLGRFTVFEPSGAYVSDVLLPDVFQPFHRSAPRFRAYRWITW